MYLYSTWPFQKPEESEFWLLRARYSRCLRVAIPKEGGNILSSSAAHTSEQIKQTGVGLRSE
jgi:hypothetical protein